MAKVAHAPTLLEIILVCASKAVQSDHSCVLFDPRFFFVQTAMQSEIIDKIPLSPEAKQ